MSCGDYDIFTRSNVGKVPKNSNLQEINTGDQQLQKRTCG